MVFRLFLGLILALGVTSLSAEEVEQSPVAFSLVADNPQFKQVLALPFRTHDERIKYGLDPFQFGLLWHAKQPKADTNSHPLVVMIHGGCWLSAYDIAHTYPMATGLAQQGVSVFNLEYRRVGETGGGWPTTFDDVLAGLKKISALSSFKQYSRVVLVGHSAGGHLALLASTRLSEWQPAGVPVSVVGLAAITDIEQYVEGSNSCQQAGAKFMGGTPEQLPKLYEAANPKRFSLELPVTLLHGASDPIVPVSQAKALRGSQVKVMMQQGAGHFDWIHPGTAAFQKLVEELKRPLPPPVTVTGKDAIDNSSDNVKQSGGRVPRPSVVF